MKGKKKILVAPLNWGLGHAARCIPIIDQLLQLEHEVILASDGASAKFLRAEYPKLKLLELPSYGIYNRYANFFLNFLPQIPSILNAIIKEKKAVQKMVEDHQISVIISDNRYGAYSEQTKNIFISHQLKLQTPYSWSTHWVNFLFPRFYKPFQEIWVPDFASAKKNLSAALGHGIEDERITYIGPLSRFANRKILSKETTFFATAILSGPEPQRSILESKLIDIFGQEPQKFALVRGKEGGDKLPNVPSNITIFELLTRDRLFDLIQDSELLISRSGYSTLMDLSFMKKKVVFIPTPGQTEQIYLADLAQQNWNCSLIQQKNIHQLNALLQNPDSLKGPTHFPEGKQPQKLTLLLNNL